MQRALFSILVCAALVQAAQPLYTIDTSAGSNWTGDGRSATSAILIQPQCVAIDSTGSVYVSDAGDHRIRRFLPGGLIQTVAGTGIAGSRGDDGPAAQAQLNTPYGLAVDSGGSLFVADLGNGVVRKIGIDGRITTFAGGGRDTPGSDGAIQAKKVKLFQPRDVAVDRAGNVYISDFGAHLVYQVTPDGLLSVVAGTGQSGAISTPTTAVKAALSYPAALALDPLNGSLLIADSANHRIRRLQYGMLTTVVDKAGKEVELGTPTGMAMDYYGRLYIADGSSRTTILSPAGEVSSVPLGGTSVGVNAAAELFATADRQVRRLTLTRVEVVAGVTGTAAAGDGRIPSEWRFTSPSGIYRDAAGFLWIADTGSGRVRRLSPSGELTTVTDQIAAPISLAADSTGRIHVGDRSTGSVFRLEGTSAPRLIFNNESRPMQPAALAFDAGDNLFIADTTNSIIRRVASDGSMTSMAGGGRESGDGSALLLKLGSPAGLAFDAEGALWFSEAATGKIRKLVSGRVTTLAGTEFKEPRALRFDAAGRLWVADPGAHRISVIDKSGQWTPVAGTGDRGFSGDGQTALGATLNAPGDVLPESDGTVLVADTGNNRIRRLTSSTPPDPAPGTNPPEPPLNSPALSVLHAATLTEQAVAPGQIIFLKGENFLSPAVSFGTTAAVVLASDTGRITVQVPPFLQPGTAEVAVLSASGVRVKATITIVASAPGILAADSGQGQALALNEDNSVNGAQNPARRGSVMTFFVTGAGSASSTVKAEIGGYAADVLWSGAAPGLTGVSQINVQTPGGFSPSGTVPVFLTFGEARTQTGVTVVSR